MVPLLSAFIFERFAEVPIGEFIVKFNSQSLQVALMVFGNVDLSVLQ